MGAAWLIAKRGDQVTSINHDAITLKTRSRFPSGTSAMGMPLAAD